MSTKRFYTINYMSMTIYYSIVYLNDNDQRVTVNTVNTVNIDDTE